MFSPQFIKDAAERAVKTAAQSALGVFVADVTVVSVDWAATGAIVGTATLVSVLTSIASANFGTPGTASAVSTPEKPLGE
ncbi:holin [Gordonia phage Faith5x5]|nr:holin [Gordonia phage Faith5x5]